ncbi:hypothetical protein F66182_8061 [Fusarium sp. NRRL 66182]|nr:hypothetical protein F66182_8061 [Fusarium sp. NRRL 66182]
MEPCIKSLAVYDYYPIHFVTYVVLTDKVYQILRERGVYFQRREVVADMKSTFDRNFQPSQVIDPKARRLWLASNPTKKQLESAGWRFGWETKRGHDILVNVLETPPWPDLVVTGSVCHGLINPQASPYQVTLGPFEGIPHDETYHYIPLTLNQLKERMGAQCQLSSERGFTVEASEPCPKRRRLNPLTPDASQSDNRSSSMTSSQPSLSPSKRSRLDSQPDRDDDHLQETPRPGRRVKIPRSESGTSLASSQSRSQASERSGYSSPTKQLNALELHKRGVIPRTLSVFRHKPPSLKALLDRINLVSSGIGIIPVSQRSVFDQLDNEVYSDFDWTKDTVMGAMCFSDQRDKLGDTPLPDTIQMILHQASYCNSQGCSEADWNVQVHHRVLEAALRPHWGNQLIDFRLSTTASIISQYHITSASSKVDFCIYINPSVQPGSEISQAINDLRGILPEASFNHTDMSPLCDKPISISIETKKTGEDWEKARLQMEVWMAAHWQFLRYLINARQRAARELYPLGQSGGENTYKLPDFMPGIIVQGDDWYLIITTPEEEKIAFWQKKSLGTTSGSKEIYQLICNLQLLRQWVLDSYWVWLRELLQGWPRRDGKLLLV